MESDNEWYIISEPFLKTVGTLTRSKFYHEGIDFFNSLELKNQQQKMLFFQCMQQTAHLAKAGLAVTSDAENDIDAFNHTQTKKGLEDVFVQDPDLLAPCNNIKEAWKLSVQSIRENLSKRLDPVQLDLARQIAEHVGKQNGLA